MPKLNPNDVRPAWDKYYYDTPEAEQARDNEAYAAYDRARQQEAEQIEALKKEVFSKHAEFLFKNGDFIENEENPDFKALSLFNGQIIATTTTPVDKFALGDEVWRLKALTEVAEEAIEDNYTMRTSNAMNNRYGFDVSEYDVDRRTAIDLSLKLFVCAVENLKEKALVAQFLKGAVIDITPKQNLLSNEL